jgi:dCMP deaminase
MIKQADLQTCVEILDAYIKRSTCARVHVAALLVRDGRVNMTGWNGVPTGFNHCSGFFKKCNVDVKTPEGRDLHRQFSERFELHGEMNVVAQCAKHGIETVAAALVQQVSPCLPCAKLIIAAGIEEVYFREFYDRHDDNGLSLLMLAGVKVFKLHDAHGLTVEQLILNDVYKPLIINGVEYKPT